MSLRARSLIHRHHYSLTNGTFWGVFLLSVLTVSISVQRAENGMRPLGCPAPGGLMLDGEEAGERRFIEHKKAERRRKYLKEEWEDKERWWQSLLPRKE